MMRPSSRIVGSALLGDEERRARSARTGGRTPGVAVLMAPVPMPRSVLLTTMSSHCPSRPRVVGGVVHGGHCAAGG